MDPPPNPLTNAEATHNNKPTFPQPPNPPTQHPPSQSSHPPTQSAQPAPKKLPPSTYLLSPTESKSIFETVIIPTELPTIVSLPIATPDPENPPVAILIAGQTGAGKSHTSPCLVSALEYVSQQRSLQQQQSTTTPEAQEPGVSTAPLPVAHFIADTYKHHHPSYHPLSFTHGTPHASLSTNPDARIWLQKTITLTSTRHAPILLESASRHPRDFKALATTLLRAGYAVHVVLMAVPAGLSRLGILKRYYWRDGTGTGGLGVRLTPRKVHEESFCGLVEVGGWVDGRAGSSSGEGGAESVGMGTGIREAVVIRRGGVVGWRGIRKAEDGGQWSVDGVDNAEGGIMEAVHKERRRKLTPEERETAIQDLKDLREKEGEVPDLKEKLDEIEGLLRPLMEGEDDKQEEFPELVPFRLPGMSGEGAFSLSLGMREES